jgi:hypothetical protein
MGFAVFKKVPQSREVRSFLGRAIHQAQAPPKYLISDSAPYGVRAAAIPQFKFRTYCMRIFGWPGRVALRLRDEVWRQCPWQEGAGTWSA